MEGIWAQSYIDVIAIILNPHTDCANFANFAPTREADSCPTSQDLENEAS